MLKKPKMILFDYGQTLVNERGFDGEKGTAAVMQYAVYNKYNRSPKEIQAQANEMNKELNRFDPATKHLFQVEVCNEPFDAYLYESQGIKLSISYEEASLIFWDHVTNGQPTEGIEDFLKLLQTMGIRSGIISNISFSGKSLGDRINRLIPENEFEFVLASSDYVFRKPNRRIFQLALEKADLQPEDVWYVGDQYECDVVGARESGMFPVWYTGAIDFQQNLKQECLKIASWAELSKLLLSL